MSRFACHESRVARLAAGGARTGVFLGDGPAVNGRTKLIGLALGLWLALEIIAFAFVLRAIGLLPAILLGLGATALGLADVRRLADVWRARSEWRSGGDRQAGMYDGALQALASLLLILPGFASDAAGLALKSPSVRAALLARLRHEGGGGGEAQGPRTIDLSPNEWKHLTPGGRPKRKRRKPDGVSSPSA
jgi:UPF0716 protein FxsA